MGKPIYIPIPAGYQVPEGTQAGQTFDESVTFELEGQRLCLKAINGVAVGDSKPDEADKAVPDQSDLAGRYQQAQAMAQQNSTP